MVVCMADPSLAQRIPVVIAEHDLPAAPRKEPANLANDLERALEKQCVQFGSARPLPDPRLAPDYGPPLS
jgi:hypothetical protein